MVSIKKKIIKNLNETGFPLEIFVSSQLTKSKWMVHNNPLYFDEELKISRELDIHAVNVDFSLAGQEHKRGRRLKYPRDANKFISHLVIQCKKSDKPWVFFDNADLSWPRIPENNFKSEHEDFHGMLFEDLKGFGLKSHRYLKNKLHKTFYESFSPPNKPSPIYEALATSVKALSYFKKRYGTGKNMVHLFIPIVVLGGSLWSASLNHRGDKLRLKKMSRVIVQFNQLSQPVSEGIRFEEEQIIEVVERDAFQKTLSELEKDNISLYRCWTKFISSF